MLDCRTYRGADIGSDHELVVAKLRLKLARNIKPKATGRLDFTMLKEERHQVEYQEEVTERITDLNVEVCSVEEGWASWRDAVMGTSEAIVGRKRRRRKDWISRKTENLVRERRRAKLARDQVGSRSSHERYRSLDRQVKSSAREDKQKWLDSVGADMERTARSREHRRMYQLVKRLSGRCAAGTPSVKGEAHP